MANPNTNPDPSAARTSSRLARLVKRRSRRKPPGLPPGSAISVGEKRSEAPGIQVWCYDRERLEHSASATLHECRTQAGKAGRIAWIHVTGLTDAGLVSDLGQALGMHPLMTEDALNTQGRSKLDATGSDLFITARIVQLGSSGIDTQHLAVFATSKLVITFCEGSTSVFEPVQARLREGLGRIRSMEADYLVWAVLDAVVDHYLLVVDHFDDQIQSLDSQMLDGVSDTELKELYRMRSDLMTLHRLVRPLRDIANSLIRHESALIQPVTVPFFRDLSDHVLHSLDQTEDLRDQATALREYAITVANQRMNEVMKMLACVSALFLPLTFLAGVYGMNFDHLPGKEWFWGFDAFVIACGLIVLGLIWFFRRRQWF
jgi:magnesium transporter